MPFTHSTHRSNPGAPRTNCSDQFRRFHCFLFDWLFVLYWRAIKVNPRKQKTAKPSRTWRIFYTPQVNSIEIANLLCFFLVDSRWIVLIHPSIGHSQQKNKEDRLSSVVKLMLYAWTTEKPTIHEKQTCLLWHLFLPNAGGRLFCFFSVDSGRIHPNSILARTVNKKTIKTTTEGNKACLRHAQ
jgi:hypothetical protein